MTAFQYDAHGLHPLQTGVPALRLNAPPPILLAVRIRQGLEHSPEVSTAFIYGTAVGGTGRQFAVGLVFRERDSQTSAQAVFARLAKSLHDLAAREPVAFVELVEGQSALDAVRAVTAPYMITVDSQFDVDPPTRSLIAGVLALLGLGPFASLIGMRFPGSRNATKEWREFTDVTRLTRTS